MTPLYYIVRYYLNNAAQRHTIQHFYLYLSFLHEFVIQFLSNLSEKYMHEQSDLPAFFFPGFTLRYPLCLSLIKCITGEVLRWQDNYPQSCFHWNCNQASGRLSHP